MGYETYFHGELNIYPPLSEEERAHIEGILSAGKDFDPNCPFGWGEGMYLEGNSALSSPEETGKYYDLEGFLEWLVENYLSPNPKARGSFDFEIQGHLCNGEIWASGEDDDDFWKLHVIDSVVHHCDGHVVYAQPVLKFGGING